MGATSTSVRLSASEIRKRFPDDGYCAFHAPRYAALLALLDEYLTSPAMSVLDIGESRLTDLVHERYGVSVDSLGFLGDGLRDHGRRWWFDLNLAAAEDQWRTDLPRYDVVVMAEVIEHLHVAPRPVLAFIRSLLVPGGILVIQTPNAVALHKRMEMLVGRNPYEEIREKQNDPGHFREYTKRELSAAVKAAGYDIVRWEADSYLDYRYTRHDVSQPSAVGALVNGVYRMMPPSLRPGQMLVARANRA
jgi:SAM-dependent methyltransferase